MLDDGTHRAKLKSKDNRRFVQVLTLTLENFKDQPELRIHTYMC